MDAAGHPKVIDFGVARAINRDDDPAPTQTATGLLVGTLHYLSPEQCAADPSTVDIRSDVYSMGLVLYELFCQRLPYDLTGVSTFEIPAVIRERSLVRPSVVTPSVRGDLETIILKALERDRERRYQSAHELARDIERFLARQPIEARPPSLPYQMRLFVRRHRTLVAAVSAVAVILMAATAISVVFARHHATRSETPNPGRGRSDPGTRCPHLPELRRSHRGRGGRLARR